MSHVAYALRAEFDGTVDAVASDGSTSTVPAYTGGVVAYGDGDSFNIAEELQAGSGRIVTDDPQLVLALDSRPELKRVPAHDADVTGTAGRYTNDPVAALRADLIMRGIAGGGRANRDQLVAAMVAHDHLVETGALVAGAKYRVGGDGLLLVDADTTATTADPDAPPPADPTEPDTTTDNPEA